MPKTITTREDFYQIISSEPILTNIDFLLEKENLSITNLASNWITFENCIFSCKSIEFKHILNPEMVLEFRDCSFNCEVSFANCNLDRLKMIDTKTIKSLDIQKGLGENSVFEVNTFQFSNTLKGKHHLDSWFSFRKANFKQRFEFENISHSDGKFEFIENIFGESEQRLTHFSFYNSEFANAFFSSNLFWNFTSFNNSVFRYDHEYLKSIGAGYKLTSFIKNTFHKVDFTKATFNDTSIFYNCDFLSTSWFEYCKKSATTHLKFVACEFKGFVLYNHSTLNLLDIDRCTYHKSVSFTDAEFNSIKLFEVKFGGGAYFDEMKINNVSNKSYLKSTPEKVLEWKRTLRAIKQELQKTENKIDFNTYRNYELNAHYKELKLLKNFKDTTILWATKWSSNFGNWFWALTFTIISGLIWYSFLYRVENAGTLDFTKTNQFFVGAFRFFLVTDFHNPLIEDSKAYLESGWSWVIFIFGKIFIAFGIYEMIQSFRKFKA